MGSLTIRVTRISAALPALVLALGARPLASQSAATWMIGGGLSLPTGDFNSYANNGWAAVAGIEGRLGTSPVALRVDAGYGVNNDTTGLGVHESTKLFTALGSVVYHLDGSRPHVYLLGGVGLLDRHFSSDDPEEIPIDDTHGVVQFAEGVTFPLGRMRGYIEGRFVTTVGPGAFQFFTVTVGLRHGDRS